MFPSQGSAIQPWTAGDCVCLYVPKAALWSHTHTHLHSTSTVALPAGVCRRPYHRNSLVALGTPRKLPFCALQHSNGAIYGRSLLDVICPAASGASGASGQGHDGLRELTERKELKA
jgi:hypothetical protein